MFKPGSAGRGCGACGAAARIRGERGPSAGGSCRGKDGQTIATCAVRQGRPSIVWWYSGRPQPRAPVDSVPAASRTSFVGTRSFDSNRHAAFRWARCGKIARPGTTGLSFRRRLLPTSRDRGWQAYPRPVRVEPLRPTGPGASFPRTDPDLRPRSRRPPARRHVSTGRRRTHPVGCTPVTRKARQRKRSEGRHANVGQDGKPLVADDPAEMRRPVARRLADAAVPRLPTPAWA